MVIRLDGQVAVAHDAPTLIKQGLLCLLIGWAFQFMDGATSTRAQIFFARANIRCFVPPRGGAKWQFEKKCPHNQVGSKIGAVCEVRATSSRSRRVSQLRRQEKKPLVFRRLWRRGTASPPRGGRRILSAIAVVFTSRSMVYSTWRSRVFILFIRAVYTMRRKMTVGATAAFCSTVFDRVLRRCAALSPI